MAQAQISQVCAFGQDITQFDMFVFQSPFLAQLHRVAIINFGSSGAVAVCFHAFGIREIHTPVTEQDMDIFAEQFRSEEGFQ